MGIKQFVVDAFASQLFTGNPAAVCPIESWIDNSLLQAIASENNLPETAFVVPVEGGYQLRWFTPVAEVDLCGHATLAAAHVLFNHLNFKGKEIIFHTRSGELKVVRAGSLLEMTFPSSPPEPCEAPDDLLLGLGGDPSEIYCAEDYLVVYPDEAAIRALSPNFQLLSQIGLRGVIVTAPGNEFDFVSRFFFPKYGINEDPVTGSAHCQLAPYWAKRLNKGILNAKQVSKRSGEIICEVVADKVLLSGRAVTFMQGELFVES
jgi:PhzF family phenazine biosynthesis protein